MYQRNMKVNSNQGKFFLPKDKLEVIKKLAMAKLKEPGTKK